MEKTVIVTTRLDEFIKPTMWFWFDETGEDVLDLSSKNIDEISKRTKLDKVVLDGLLGFTHDMHESLKAIKGDLSDLYLMIEALEEKK